MLPYLIAGAIGFVVGKLFEEDEAPKYANGGLIAPNGKPSNLTPEQYKLVRTDAFKNWFGDWQNDPANASKVVDENGEPLVVYHGTNKKFNVFDVKKSRFDYLYFAVNKEYAEKFGKIKSYFINARKIKDATSIGLKKITRDKAYKLLGWKKEPTYTYTKDEFWQHLRFSDEINETLRLNNYDGVKYIEDFTEDESNIQTEAFAILNPSIIKLADGTNTTFDGSNSDIRFEDGGSVSKYKDYRIEIEEIPKYLQVNATITQNGNQIGFISLDDFPNEPYVSYSRIDEEHSGKGLGSYVYDLLDDYSFNKTGKHITHGDINSSISAIRLWRKRLKDPNYIPDGFYNYWGDDADEVLKELNNPDIRFDGGGEIKVKKIKGELRYYNKGAYANVNIVDKDEWHLSMIENQSGEKGVASKILLQIIKDARANNVKKISLSASYENRQIFHYNYGFKTISYGEYSGLYNMELDLSWKYAGKQFKADWDDDVYIHEEFDLGGTTMRKSKLLAPNGKPSNLTPEQYKLVRTPEFKAWFGDWQNDPANASKVVDENGEPLVVYHSTGNKFNVFDIISNKSSGIEIGSHFGSKSQAIFLANRDNKNSFLIESFLRIMNPLIVEDKGKWTKSIYKNILIKLGYNSSENWENTNAIIQSLLKIGIDGFEYENKYEGKGKSYIVIQPNQIKLADGSNTTFDGSNPDIRFDEGGRVSNYREFYDNLQIEDGSKYIGQKFADVFPFIGKKTTPSQFRISVKEYVELLSRLEKDNYTTKGLKTADLNRLEKRQKYIDNKKYLSRFYLDPSGTIIGFDNSDNAYY